MEPEFTTKAVQDHRGFRPMPKAYYRSIAELDLEIEPYRVELRYSKHEACSGTESEPR
jgi:hypothetical protein